MFYMWRQSKTEGFTSSSITSNKAGEWFILFHKGGAAACRQKDAVSACHPEPSEGSHGKESDLWEGR